jgi:hypothetical protein
MPLRNALRLLAVVLIACLLQRVRSPPKDATVEELHTLFALAVLALCADAAVYKKKSGSPRDASSCRANQPPQ